ncbi:hypothetical protein Csa_016711 [Cucumis sativus]|uniref:Uncharacterized protein n=1 Tax=Cucumis sativus TaxID=3659 RepID=A0A0A0K702_CUCSA|nr:hypothetical protein Csa_016711 [Cucumis sativus]
MAFHPFKSSHASPFPSSSRSPFSFFGKAKRFNMRRGKNSRIVFALIAGLLLLVGIATAMARPIHDSAAPLRRPPIPPSGRNPCSHVPLPGDGRHCL